MLRKRMLIAACAMAACVASPSTAQQAGVEARLVELGIELFEPPPPVANYVRATTVGNLVFIAGHGPQLLDEEGNPSGYVMGKVGGEVSVEQGYQAARLTAISILSTLKAEIGDLNRVRRIARVFGMVNAVEGVTQQPEVINGASDLLVEIFGERGKHARAAVGMASLPRNISVEIEMVVEIEPR
jgi:enamine deaminase RidA (YjgF/YER057c/UK114 family)